MIFTILTPACEISSRKNFFLQKLYADNELRNPSTLSSSHRFSNSTENHFVVETLSKLWKCFATYDQLACRCCNCKWIIGFSLQWDGSSSLTATHVDPKKQHTAFNYYPFFFSSALQFVLTLDDGLVKTKRDEIHVF